MIDEKTYDDESDETHSTERTRRRFLTSVGVGALATSAAGSGALFVQFASPNVLYEPSLWFVAGSPDDYDEGVDERWKGKQRIWIVRSEDGIYALVAICTHLGCSPNWDPQDRVFRCPCHGSVFSIEGDALAGPASEPLYRASVALDEEARMIVGTGLLGYGRPGQANREPDRSAPEFALRI